MNCVNNPCPEFLPKVGDSSPIVGIDGQTSNLNLAATHFSGGRRRTRRHRRHHKKQHKTRHARKGGKSRKSRKSRHSKRH